MTQTEQIAAAKEFAEFWADKGDEKQESQRFWIDLLQKRKRIRLIFFREPTVSL